MSSSTPSIALIGLGPRGVSTLERMIAQLNSITDPPQQLDLHLIDDAQHGGGKVWDIAQPSILCMNTFAHGMTLFAEPGATVSAPVVEGPTIYEWVRLHLGDESEVSEEKLAYVKAHPLDPAVNERFSVEELEAIKPASYPPRALYGYYLLWYFNSIVADVPEWVHVVAHKARATRIDKGESVDTISLSNGVTINADATIAVTGWQEQGPSKQDLWIKDQLGKDPRLNWIPADNPIDQDIDSIKDNENVLARGLGMGFFDILILTTVGRGGRFVEDSSVPEGLRYEATGKEPHFYASSRRGYPFMPQSDDRGLPEPAAIPRLKKAVAELSTREGERSIDYDVEVWPSVLRDAYHAYVSTLARVEPEALKTSEDEIVAAIDAAQIDASATCNGISAMDEIIEEHTTKKFSILKWINLIPANFADAGEVTEYLVSRMEEDLAEAELGPDSPMRAALWSIGWSRKPTQILGAEGRYTVESRHNMFDKAVNLGQMACSGPPIFRTRELLALVRAGIVTFIGGNPLLDVDLQEGQWVMSSPTSGQHRYHGTTLLDAWVNKPDIRREPADELVRNLRDSGRLVPFTETTEDGTELPTGSAAQHPVSRRVLTEDGSEDPRLHMVGIPAHSQYPDTTISPPIPGTDPWFIQETDKAAVSAVAVALGR